jgi:hypothetical protein
MSKTTNGQHLRRVGLTCSLRVSNLSNLRKRPWKTRSGSSLAPYHPRSSATVAPCHSRFGLTMTARLIHGAADGTGGMAMSMTCGEGKSFGEAIHL